MAEIISPGTLESFAEKQIKTLLEAQLTLVPDDNILTGHCTDGEKHRPGGANGHCDRFPR